MKIYTLTSLLLIVLLLSCSKKKYNATELSNSYNTVAIDTGDVSIVNNKPNKKTSDSLSIFFKEKRDEFDEKNSAWILHKFQNDDLVRCYFRKEGDSYNNFRLSIVYKNHNWIFFKKAIFSIDGEKVFTYIPDNIETNTLNGRILEHSDNAIRYSEIEILEAFKNATKVKIKLIGDSYFDVLTLPKKDIKSIYETYLYYKSLGGDFN